MASVHSVGSHDAPSAPPELSMEGPRTSGGAGPSNDNDMITVIIENIPPDFDDYYLDMLIDDPDQGIEMDGTIISSNIDSQVATVTFSSTTDAQKLLEKEFLEHKNYRMPVRKPMGSNSLAVLIRGISKNVDKALMEMYFSNRKKSGGGKIVEVKYFEPENGFAVILYTEENVARAVINKRIHKLRNWNLTAEQWIPGEEKKLRKVTDIPRDEAGPKQLPYEQNEMTKQDIGSQRVYPGSESSDLESRHAYQRSAQYYRSEEGHMSRYQHGDLERGYWSAQDNRSRYDLGSGQDFELRQAHGSGQGRRSELYQYQGSERDYRSMQDRQPRYDHGSWQERELEQAQGSQATQDFPMQGRQPRYDRGSWQDRELEHAQGSQATQDFPSQNPMYYNRQRRYKETAHGEEDDEEEENKSDSEEEEEIQSCAILVEGLSLKTREETIRRFFEKRSKSGGGLINKVTAREDGSYIIVFKERSSVDRILKRDQLSLDDNPITVKELSSPKFEDVQQGPIEPRIVYLRGDLSKLSRDALILYLEEISGVEVEQVVYGTKEGTAIVVFKDAFNYRNLQKAANRKPVEDVMLGIGKVICSKTIQVYLDEPTEEPIMLYMLRLYFENKQESGGSGKVSVERVGKHYYLVHFEHAAIAQRVAGRKCFLQGKKLVVSIYYSGLGLIPVGYDTSKPLLKITTHKIVEVDPLKVKYVKETKEVMVKVNNFLRSRYARLDPSHDAENEIKIICELQPDMENVRTLVEQWDNEISDAIHTIMADFDQNSVQYLPKFRKQICERLQAYKETNDKMVMIVEKEEDHVMNVIGPKTKLEEVLNDVKVICQDVQEIQEQVKEEMEVPYGKLGLLLKRNIKDTLREKWPKVCVEENKKDEKLTFSGKPVELLKVMKFVQSELKDMTEHVVAMSTMQLQVINSKTGWKQIQTLLQESKLVAVIECDTDNVIIIGDKKTTKQVEALLRAEIIESSINISEDNQQVLQNQEWNQFINNLLEKHQGNVVLNMKPDKTSISIAAIAQNHEMFKEKLMNFLKANTVKKQFIPASKGCVKLLHKYSQSDLKQIELEFVRFGVHIVLEEKGPNIGFLIKGISEGFVHAVTRVKDLITSVISDSQAMRQHGLPQFLTSDNSTLILSGVEAENRVIIEVIDTREKNAQALALESFVNISSKMEVLYVVETERGITIKVLVGDITEIGADVLVNPADKRLQHNAGLAQALVEKGGNSIQQESDDWIKVNGRLDVGDAAITTAGTLHAKRIIHAVGPHWRGGGQGEEDYLHDCVSRCLTLAKKQDLGTIAIPAIGTGVSGIPVDTATVTIAEAINDFLIEEDDDCHLNEVYLIDENKRNAESFVKAVKKLFGMTEKRKQQKFTGGILSTGVLSRPSSLLEDLKDSASAFVTKEGVKITIVQGEIAKQTTNAIVNSIPSNLKLTTGALSNSIMAGMSVENKSSVQAEADRYKSQGVGNGDVIATGAGNLACQKIFHIILPEWKTDPATVKLLPDAIDKILSECHQAGLTSLAIPAIGTGNLKWPANVVAESFFDAVIRFSSKEVGTNLKTIYFVIYPRDTKSVAAFNSHLVSLRGKRSERKLAPTPGIVEEPAGATGGDWMHDDAGLASPPIAELRIKKVKLQVTTGDITKETTDGIVNSFLFKLDLTVGAVSQALAKAGGDSLVDECHRIGKVAPDSVVVTGAGNMRCKNVIHFHVPKLYGNWKDAIKRCLHTAEKWGMRSLTFPALGTGRPYEDPAEMAMYLMEAVADFARSGFTGLTLVRVVIFQTNMFQLYLSKMEEVRRAKHSLWGTAKKFLGFGGDVEGKSGTVTMYQSSSESACLDIHGFSKDDINKAYEDIEKQWEDQRADQTIGGKSEPKLMEIIKKLSENEQKRIESMGNPHNVKVEVDASRKIAKIRVRGQLKDASVVVASIRSQLHEVEMQEQEKEQAQLLCQYVQWEFEERPGVFTPYPEDMNGRIEKAHANNQKTVTWLEQLGDGIQKTITLDLVNMHELDNSTYNKIRRRDLSQGGYSLPAKWSIMDQGDRCTKVRLNPTDAEYVEVSTAFQLTSQNVIIQIERIQNPTLYRRYIVHKMDMEAEMPNVQIEKMLWHGTHSGVIDKINHVGFNRSFNGANGVLYGKGVYFARDASYSVNYASANANNAPRQMYYASVLTGEFCIGDKNMIEPPPKSPADPNLLYNSTVDNLQNPKIYVVYLDTQVYPHYLVTFR